MRKGKKEGERGAANTRTRKKSVRESAVQKKHGERNNQESRKQKQRWSNIFQASVGSFFGRYNDRFQAFDGVQKAFDVAILYGCFSSSLAVSSNVRCDRFSLGFSWGQLVHLGFAVGCLMHGSLIKGGDFQWFLDLNIRGSNKYMDLSLSWCLIDDIVVFGMINYKLLYHINCRNTSY